MHFLKSVCIAAAFCTGCCSFAGQYQRVEGVVEGEVDPKVGVAILPVMEVKTRGMWNVHRLECGQVQDSGAQPKVIESVVVPLAFCFSAVHRINQFETFASGTVVLKVAGQKTDFIGWCHSRRDSITLAQTYRVHLETRH